VSIVQIKHLVKTYADVMAVDDFSFTVEPGELVALMGPDGAGKTSTFRALCGLIMFDSGEITVAGHDVSHEFDKIKPLLGYMPQTFSLYPDLSVEENLRFYAGLFGLDATEFKRKQKQLYEFSGLEPFASRRAEALSGGMKQKLALSCNLIHDPEILVLDEPTTGVDPLSRRQFWDILRMLKASGSAIVVSTPYMDEVALADRAVFLLNGKELAKGTPTELTRQFRGNVYRANLVPTTERMTALNDVDGISARRFGAGMHVYLDPGITPNRYAGILKSAGINPDALTEIPPGLEDTFIQLMEH